MRTSLRDHGLWVDAIVITSIVAAGTAVAGITNEPPADTVAIPGCDTVVPAGSSVSFAIGTYGGSTYDNPEYPWLTAPKATAMSQALVGALPDAVELEYAEPSWSMVFQPIDVYPEDASLPDGIEIADISGASRAKGFVLRDDVRGKLRVSVKASDFGVLPCVEGFVDERVTLADGTVVDTLEAVSELEGVETHRRSAIAYAAGNRVSASMSDRGDAGTLPLTVEELRAIVTEPGLRVGTPVADGTPAPRRDCGTPRESFTPSLSREVVDRVGAALTEQWAATLPDARTGIPIGDLVPGPTGSGIACNAVEVTTSQGTGSIEVAISNMSGDGWRDPDVSSIHGRTRTTLPDGTVVTTDIGREVGRTQIPDAVSVLRPSNTLIQFRVENGPDFASLIAVGSGPGLDL